MLKNICIFGVNAFGLGVQVATAVSTGNIYGGHIIATIVHTTLVAVYAMKILVKDE